MHECAHTVQCEVWFMRAALSMPACYMQAVGWMREQWVQGLNAVLADEKGLGRTATVITFLQCLR